MVVFSSVVGTCEQRRVVGFLRLLGLGDAHLVVVGLVAEAHPVHLAVVQFFRPQRVHLAEVERRLLELLQFLLPVDDDDGVIVSSAGRIFRLD